MNDDTETLRDAFRSFFSRESPPERVRAAETARPPGFDADLWARAGTLGLPGLAVEGATLADLTVIAEEAGRALVPIPVVETLVAARLLDRLGAADQVRPDSLVTVAVRPAEEGVASLVPAGAVADRLLVCDRDRLLLVDDGRGEPIAPTLAHGPVAMWAVTGSARVLAEGPAARAAFERAGADWRILTTAALVGLARRALELGVDYAKARHQFGVPIGSFQALQHRLADVATLVDAAGLLSAATAATDPARPIEASRAYLTAVRAARDAAGASLHVHGGYGFMVEYDVQLYFRRAAAWPLLLGDPAAERERLADLLEADGWTRDDPPRSDYQAEVRRVVSEACTPAVRARVATSGTVHDWPLHRRLADAGFLAAAWPAPWGGRDNIDAEAILWEELERAGAPTDGWGTSDLVARTLALVGRDEQRDAVIPPVLAGELLICLGYSEPDSGSDAAAATTRAERDGDHWVINGQKMFTTLAHEAGYVFLLTRTNLDVRKHRGLTMFLVPMDTPGIEVTPIWTLSGERTNITFYRDVRVPDSARVGEVDGGWDVMRVALDVRAEPDHARGTAPGAEPVRRLGGGTRWRPRAAERAGPRRRRRGRPGRWSFPRRAHGRPVGPRGAAGGRGLDGEAVLLRGAGSAHRGAARRARRRGAPRPGRAGRPRGGRAGGDVPPRAGDDDPRRDERDPAGHHRRAGPGPPPGRALGLGDC